MRLESSLGRWARAAPYVFKVCNCLKMLWIYTVANSTEMVNLETFGYWANEKFV